MYIFPVFTLKEPETQKVRKTKFSLFFILYKFEIIFLISSAENLHVKKDICLIFIEHGAKSIRGFTECKFFSHDNKK